MPQIEIRYFGISAFEITSERGVKVVIDPCITELRGVKYSPVGLEALPKVDIILVSHAAGDHLGDTLELARQTGSDVLAGADVGTYLAKSGYDPSKILRATWGNMRHYKGLMIRVVESHHRSWMVHEGEVLSDVPVGFILYTESGMGIYHPGDTSISNDLKLFGELYRPEIGLLPVSSTSGLRERYELSPEEAALVAKWMGFKLVIPTHYALGSPDPHDFARYVRRDSPEIKVVIMEPGEKMVYEY